MTTAELDFLVGRLRQRAAERPEKPTVQEMRDGFDELAELLPTPADAVCKTAHSRRFVVWAGA